MNDGAPISKRLPYPGLRSFHRDESSLFFGRDGCVDQMIDRLAKTRFLAVLGSSGTGKSSLVHTGLLDGLSFGLMAEAEPGWHIASMRPGGSPFDSLARALLELPDLTTSDATEVGLFAALLRRGSGSVTEWCRDGNLRPHTNLLILVDQFEELFRYEDYAGQDDAEAFSSMLIESARAHDVPIYVVITMRSEYLGACALIPYLAETINEGLYLTRRMTRDEIAEAIVRPAEVCGFKIEPNLVNRLLNDLASFAPWESGSGVDRLQALARRADQLPVMQHILNRLWVQAEAATEDPAAVITLSLAAYEELGGASAALGAHADAVLESIPEPSRPAAQRVFRALISGETVASAVRRPCRLDELIALADGAREAVVTVVAAFRRPDCNFLVISPDTDLADDSTIDISHESLIRQWTTLADWLQAEARAAEKYREFEKQAQGWSQGRRNLLRGEELRDAVSWLESERPSATWARRYSRGANPDDAFILTLRFIRRSELQRNRWRTGGVIGAFTMTIVIVALLILGAKTLFEQSALRRGDAYYYGHGVLKNDVLARNWYRKASWFGNAEAESDLGMLYEAGIGGASPNCQEAIKWFIKAARDGSTLAADHIADLQAEGCRTSGRERQSLLPTLDDVSEEYGMASDSLLKGQYKQALAEYEKVLQTNSADPQTRVDAADEIGLLYETGKGGIAHSDAAAHEAFTQALDLELSILNEMPSDPPSMSNVAYQWLLVGVPANALSMANFALVQPSDQIWMEVNKADALMLLGQTDAARAAYLKHKAADPDGKGSTWGADILEDFDTFRSIGIKNPLMAEVTMDLGK